MYSALAMWRNTRMIVLTSVVAALYVAAYVALAPFSITFVPDVIVFSARDMFILLFGILFGPAGAWGLGIGNVVGDFVTGNFGPGSVFGFLVNFIVASLGYMLWSRFGPPAETQTAARSRVRSILVYAGIGVVTAAAGAVVLGWGLNALGLAPFRVVSVVLFFNLMIGSWVGGWIYLLLWRRVDALNLTWNAVMDDEPTRRPIVSPWIGLILVVIGGGGGMLDGVFRLGGLMAPDAAGAGFFVLIILGTTLL